MLSPKHLQIVEVLRKPPFPTAPQTNCNVTAINMLNTMHNNLALAWIMSVVSPIVHMEELSQDKQPTEPDPRNKTWNFTPLHPQHLKHVPLQTDTEVEQ